MAYNVMGSFNSNVGVTAMRGRIILLGLGLSLLAAALPATAAQGPEGRGFYVAGDLSMSKFDANQDELEARISEQLAAEPGLLVQHRLAIDGHDLQRELGMAPGPEIGEVLERLTEAVLDDPSRNRRDILLDLARRR